MILVKATTQRSSAYEVCKRIPQHRLILWQALMTFQILYCASLIFIKSSICVALIRLVISKRLLYTLYAILTLSASYGFIAMMTVLLQCRPLKATWDPSAGTCSNGAIIVRLSYFVTACSITTDFACAVMPFVILWNLQMRKRLKFTIAAMLSLGFLYVAHTDRKSRANSDAERARQLSSASST
jgi:hypothetical protein